MKSLEPRVPAVYSIICLPNSKRYIGASGHVQNRVAVHKSRLRGGTHDIDGLQADFNQFGEDQFEFKICEMFLSRKDAIKREAEMLRQVTDWEMVYNTKADPRTSVMSPESSASLLELLTNMKKLLERAREMAGSFAELERQSGIDRSTLWRIGNGKAKNLHPRTVGALIKVINQS